eukprot:8002164-Alexandrium_andersonii.AAC.1
MPKCLLVTVRVLERVTHPDLERALQILDVNPRCQRLGRAMCVAQTAKSDTTNPSYCAPTG